MAQVIENKKGFRVIQVTLSDCIKWAVWVSVIGAMNVSAQQVTTWQF